MIILTLRVFILYNNFYMKFFEASHNFAKHYFNDFNGMNINILVSFISQYTIISETPCTRLKRINLSFQSYDFYCS